MINFNTFSIKKLKSNYDDISRKNYIYEKLKNIYSNNL